jgi:hypothetical protein
MQEETKSAESAGKDEDATIAHVEPLLREEMRRDLLTEKTAEELIKRLVEDYQCESGSESGSDEEDDTADESEGGDGEGGGGSDDGGGDDPPLSTRVEKGPAAVSPPRDAGSLGKNLPHSTRDCIEVAAAAGAR